MIPLTNHDNNKINVEYKQYKLPALLVDMWVHEIILTKNHHIILKPRVLFDFAIC